MGDIKYFVHFDYLGYLQNCKKHLDNDKFEALLECDHIKVMKEFNIFSDWMLSGPSIMENTTTVDQVLPYNTNKSKYIPNFNLSFAECCDLRACQIIEDAIRRDKKIIVRYSGGTDSTVLLVSFLKYLPIDEMERLEVAMNVTSIVDNPHFFHKVVSGLPLISNVDIYKSEDPYTTGIIIDGNEEPWWDRFGLWTDITGQDLNDFVMPDNELFNKLYDEAPMPIRNNNDKIRWTAFNYFASYASTRSNSQLVQSGLQKLNTDESVALYKSSQVSPYAADMFINWKLTNWENLPTRGPLGYPAKKEAWDYISDYIGEPYYNISAASGGIYRTRFAQDRHVIGLDQNCNVIHSYDITLINKLADLFISGGKFNEMA